MFTIGTMGKYQMQGIPRVDLEKFTITQALVSELSFHLPGKFSASTSIQGISATNDNLVCSADWQIQGSWNCEDEVYDGCSHISCVHDGRHF
jgi:hypothetical protein